MHISEELGAFLARFQDYQNGGLKDPDTKKHIDNSYGNAFFALLCALLASKEKNEKKEAWLKRAHAALRYELAAAKRYAAIPGIYRWEFKNYAVLSAYPLIREALSHEEKKEVRGYLLRSKNIDSFQANYVMMRALSFLLRYRLFGKRRDLIRSRLELRIVLSRQDSDGFFWDGISHPSFQYHAYVLALLFQYHQLRPSQKLRKAFLRGVDFLLPFVDQDGEFNYFGRGQKQVFGDAAFIYVLAGAAFMTGNRFYAGVTKKIKMRLNRTVAKKEIVAGCGQKERTGWYAYNNRADYLAFAACYLLMAERLLEQCWGNGKEKTFEKIVDYSKPFNRMYEKLGLFLLREKDFLICIGASSCDSAELPLIHHVYPRYFPTSGGPPFFLGEKEKQEQRKQQQQKQKNYLDIFFGLRFDDAQNPFYRHEGKIWSGGNTVTLKYNWHTLAAQYVFSFDKEVQIKLTIFPKKKVRYVPIHFVSAKSAGKSGGKKIKTSAPVFAQEEVQTLDGRMAVFESAEEEFSLPKSYVLSFGKLKEQHNILPFVWQRKKTGMPHQLSKAIYFSAVLSWKLLFDCKDFVQMVRYYKERKKYYG